MKKKFKRRRYPILDRSLQYRFLVMILSYGMIMVIFLGIFLFVPDFINMNNEDLSIVMREAAAKRVLALHSRVWPFIIALICILGLHSFRFFLRIVGPLYRFRWAFSKVAKGDLNFRVKLRKRDYLDREAGALNKMIDVLEKKWGSMELTGQDALKSLAALEQSSDDMGEKKEPFQKFLKTHQKHLENLVDKVRFFRPKEEEKVA